MKRQLRSILITVRRHPGRRCAVCRRRTTRRRRQSGPARGASDRIFARGNWKKLERGVKIDHDRESRGQPYAHSQPFPDSRLIRCCRQQRNRGNVYRRWPVGFYALLRGAVTKEEERERRDHGQHERCVLARPPKAANDDNGDQDEENWRNKTGLSTKQIADALEWCIDVPAGGRCQAVMNLKAERHPVLGRVPPEHGKENERRDDARDIRTRLTQSGAETRSRENGERYADGHQDGSVLRREREAERYTARAPPTERSTRS